MRDRVVKIWSCYRIEGFGAAMAAIVLIVALSASPTFARDPCKSNNIPNCELQKQKPIRFTALLTRGWAFYCTGDHPYFYGYQDPWNAGNAKMFSYTWNNNCFSVAENSLYDGINKLDVTITNWCLKTETITLTLACSATPPPELAGCETVGKPMSDPSCPAGPTKTYCSNSIPPVCMQLYSEKCSNDVKYYCVKDSVLPAFCMQCKPGSTVDGKPDVQAKEE